MKNKLLILFLLCIGPALALAAEGNLHPLCHKLMTVEECSEHLARLASLPAGEAREAYLAEYARTRKERESACTCSHSMAARVIPPLQRQALLAF